MKMISKLKLSNPYMKFKPLTFFGKQLEMRRLTIFDILWRFLKNPLHIVEFNQWYTELKRAFTFITAVAKKELEYEMNAVISKRYSEVNYFSLFLTYKYNQIGVPYGMVMILLLVQRTSLGRLSR